MHYAVLRLTRLAWFETAKRIRYHQLLVGFQPWRHTRVFHKARQGQ